ncbi:hypothetical protein [Mucilaginibacter aurantiaciroseus]|uniref:hypothetical protein n=1 Tax=Mucilaginibacter aurantiaciroseus TaxID=2949308 RepID=UPI003513D3C5
MGRSLKHLLELTSYFEKKGVGLISLDDHIYTDTTRSGSSPSPWKKRKQKQRFVERGRAYNHACTKLI